MAWWEWALLWLPLAVVVAMGIGKSIKIADRRE